MILVFGLKGKGAWLMLCVQGGRRQARTQRRWIFFIFFSAVEFSIVAGHCRKPGRMSLVFGLKGKGAWLMLCVQGGRRQARTERRWIFFCGCGI
jgi:hypothetical protein